MAVTLRWTEVKVNIKVDGFNLMFEGYGQIRLTY